MNPHVTKQAPSNLSTEGANQSFISSHSAIPFECLPDPVFGANEEKSLKSFRFEHEAPSRAPPEFKAALKIRIEVRFFGPSVVEKEATYDGGRHARG